MAGAGGRRRRARRIVTVEKTEAQKWSGHAFALPIGVLSSAPEASVDEGVNGRAAKCQRAPPSGWKWYASPTLSSVTRVTTKI
jgi:hypothetical protein